MRQLIEALKRFEDSWISDEITGDPAQISRARLILRVCLYCMPPVFIILGMGWFEFPERRHVTLLMLLGHLLVSTSGISLRWAKSVTIPGIIFLIFGAIQLLGSTYMTGSIVSPVVYAFPVLVSLASILVNIRVAIGIGLLLLIGAWITWLPDNPAYMAFTEHSPLPIRLFTLGWSMATGIGIAWLFTQERRRSESALRRAIEDRDRFVTYISHELRNPLTAIIGAADLLALEEAPPPPRLVDALHRSAHGMTRVLDDLLDISKGDAGMLALSLSPTPVRPLLDGMISELAPLAETRGISLSVEATEVSDHQVLAAGRRLEQVLRNLLHNSLKFTESAGHVTLRVKQEGTDYLRFEVVDTGIGIKASELKTILEPFRQAQGSVAGGTGLGLPISQFLLSAMDTELEIHSKPGHGSCFGFLLPLTEGPASVRHTTQKTITSTAAPQSPQRSLAGMRVLLAEDNAAAREVLRSVLEELSCVVEVAVDGVEALERVESHRPQVLLLDIQMPRRDGISAARELRRQFAAGETEPFSLIAVTGNAGAHEDLAEEGLFDQVLAKPVGFSELRSCLAQVANADVQSD